MAIALITSLARRLPELNALMHTRPPRELFGWDAHGHLAGRAVLGVVGMGRIGGRVADFAHLMGMRVLYTARTPSRSETRWAIRAYRWRPDEKSDFITLHCPHTPQTEGMISREMIALMKPTAYLINTARGPVVDEDALIEACALIVSPEPHWMCLRASQISIRPLLRLTMCF